MAKGRVFNIQRYSIHDGPGIRTILFLKGCPLRCPWCSNPESQRFERELAYTVAKCIQCGSCIKNCIQDALKLTDGMIRVDRNLCTACGDCAQSCWSEALEIIGRDMSVDEAYECVERDRAFYETSGGGVTVSGGEPLMQADFVSEFLETCKRNGINTAIETAGYQQWSEVEKVYPFVDTWLYDIKIFDSEKHQRITGAANGLIISNARRIAASGGKMIIRVPVIPGINDTAEEIAPIVRFAEEIEAEYVNLLPYHRLGESKYSKIGREVSMKGTVPPTKESLEEIVAGIDTSIRVLIGG